jgi:hypothetical protein
MSFTLHELLGLRYPVYYCEHCEQSFIHSSDERSEHCPVCTPAWLHNWEIPPCDHTGDELIEKRP